MARRWLLVLGGGLSSGREGIFPPMPQDHPAL